MNVELLKTIISSSAQVISAIIPAAAVYLASKQYLATKNAQQTALAALLEVKFYRELETIMCHELSALNGKTENANRIWLRKELSKNGIKSEGKLSPKELERRINTYELAVKKNIQSNLKNIIKKNKVVGGGI